MAAPRGNIIPSAGMVELADTLDLGSNGLAVQVQVLLPAPYRVFTTNLSYGHSVFLFLPCFLHELYSLSIIENSVCKSLPKRIYAPYDPGQSREARLIGNVSQPVSKKTCYVFAHLPWTVLSLDPGERTPNRVFLTFSSKEMKFGLDYRTVVCYTKGVCYTQITPNCKLKRFVSDFSSNVQRLKNNSGRSA